MNAIYSTHLSSYVLKAQVGQNIIGIPKNNKRYKFCYKIVFFPILQSKLFNIPSFAFLHEIEKKHLSSQLVHIQKYLDR